MIHERRRVRRRGSKGTIHERRRDKGVLKCGEGKRGGKWVKLVYCKRERERERERQGKVESKKKREKETERWTETERERER